MATSAERHLPLAQVESHHRTKGLLRLTMACNERCPFCNVPVEDYAHPTPAESEVMSELDAFVAEGERTLTISGGEPTLYRDRLIRVVARARAGGVPFIELQTNAVLIDADYARALSAAGLTSGFVSLLSHKAELHDELAGLEGAFGRCLAGIDALLDAGVAVTLNPVTARSTEALVADYVDFVAERLPRVRAISLSAVQPHGRARQAPELMPDYAVLAREVPRARERARRHGITLLNPYCGLPLCIGWQDDREHSVEAIEALSARASLARHDAHGIENRGNKRHGAPCRACALRTVCGGAWHAYWDLRDGSGIAAPLARVEPWQDGAAPGQSVVSAEALGEAEVARLRAATTPTVWFLCQQLNEGDAARLAQAGVTDLALLTDDADRTTLAELTALARDNAGLEPQSRIRVVVGLRRLGSFSAAYRLMEKLRESGVEAVRLLVKGDERHARFVAEAGPALGLEVTLW
jgi:MoaA/NifB/PqqE/SkfB family radical SAM enzyme